jgi:uncharacterized membrane protein YfcA
MEILGYIAAIIIGISLGLIGGGGSILTVPVLAYLMGISPLIATSYSLFIVGISSLIGVVTFIKRRSINYLAAIIFALPSFFAVIFARSVALPLLPKQIKVNTLFEISKDRLLMIVFSLLMITASYFMIRVREEVPVKLQNINSQNNRIKIGLIGLIVGFLSGMVGAGGGFIIIPALVLFAGLEMKTAVGTSLLIVAFNSIIGFLSSLHHQALNWSFLLVFTAFSVLGIIIGSFLTNFIEGEKLKKSFGFFILVMGFFILLKELF